MGWLWVLVFCILAVSPSTVLAHASLIKSVPARRAQIFKSPPQIQLWFSERLEARFSSLRVIDSSGNRVDLDNVAVGYQRSQKNLRWSQASCAGSIQD